MIFDETLQYRQAGPADIDQLAELRWRLATDDRPDVDPFVKQQFLTSFTTVLADIGQGERMVHFVAQEKSLRLVAALSIVRVSKIPAPGDLNGQWGYLTNVYTLPASRNRGIGSALLAAARQWAHAQQLELLVVWPSDRSVAFYERAGFRRGQDPLVLNLHG